MDFPTPRAHDHSRQLLSATDRSILNTRAVETIDILNSSRDWSPEMSVIQICPVIHNLFHFQLVSAHYPERAVK